MPIPINLLRYAGIWNATTAYYVYDFVESPTDNLCYINTSTATVTGGLDPVNQPSAIWTPYSVGGGGGSFPLAYASFSASGTQNITQNSETVLIYDTQDIVPLNISVKMPGSKEIIPLNAGLYKVLSSVQVSKSTGGTGNTIMYPKVNGVPLANSATSLTTTQSTQDLITVEWFIYLNSAEPLEIAMYTPNSGIQAFAVPAATPPNPTPAIPSIITTIMRIA